MIGSEINAALPVPVETSNTRHPRLLRQQPQAPLAQTPEIAGRPIRHRPRHLPSAVFVIGILGESEAAKTGNRIDADQPRQIPVSTF
jgi:hypothetical protein